MPLRLHCQALQSLGILIWLGVLVPYVRAQGKLYKFGKASPFMGGNFLGHGLNLGVCSAMYKTGFYFR